MAREQIITERHEYDELCRLLRRARRVAIDTEFVPEFTYSPQLCLVQVATDDMLALIDPFAIDPLDEFWDAILRPDCELVAHASKEELNFCMSQGGRLPERLFDVQLAAGLVGLGYPLSLQVLTQRVTSRHLRSNETRTDWRKRPLDPKQIEYALDDVRHLLDIRDRLGRMLADRQRTNWMDEEVESFLADSRQRDESEPWQRVQGAARLDPLELSVLRAVAEWRDRRARRLDKPPRWILRDDVLVELARRQPSAVQELERTRGLNPSIIGRWGAELLAAVTRGQEEPPARLAAITARRRESQEDSMSVKILSAYLIHLATENDIAVGLLGSNEDLRQLVSWRGEGCDPTTTPRLARGWRAQVCGSKLEQLLQGGIAIRLKATANGLRITFE